MLRPVTRRARADHPGSGANDEGSVSIFFVVAAVALIVAIGLGVDGGGKIRALQRADAVAAEAARTGGQAIQAGTAVRGQGIQADVVAAKSAAQTYLDSAGIPGVVTVTDGTTLRVQTTTTYTPTFLSIVGVGPQPVTGQAQVRLVRSLDGER